MTTTAKLGRLGNQIVRNVAVSIIAQKHDLYVDYCSKELICDQLGIELHSGDKKYSESVVLDDFNYFPILEASSFPNNLNPNVHYFQSSEISKVINKYLHDMKPKIIEKNPFQNRYDKNNDLYVHIRLADTAQWNPGIDYYLKAISSLVFDHMFFSTDDSEHEIIKQIEMNYPNATILTLDEIKTIQFASTCKYIVLSHGSFSATIGHLGFFSNIYYPKFEVNKSWCGDMFSIDGWTKVSW